MWRVLLVSSMESTFCCNLFWGFIVHILCYALTGHSDNFLFIVDDKSANKSHTVHQEARIRVKNALAGMTSIMICTMVDN